MRIPAHNEMPNVGSTQPLQTDGHALSRELRSIRFLIKKIPIWTLKSTVPYVNMEHIKLMDVHVIMSKIPTKAQKLARYETHKKLLYILYHIHNAA
jgi:hypothetical protein